MSPNRDHVRARMTMRCLVQRNTQTTPDPYGASEPAVWTTLHESLACWAYTAKGAEVVSGATVQTVEAPMMLVPLGTDITELDRVSQVLTRAGEVYRDGVFSVTSVVEVHNHLEVKLREVE